MTGDRRLPYLPIPTCVSNTYLFSFLSFLLLLLGYLLPLSYLLFILSPYVLTLSHFTRTQLRVSHIHIYYLTSLLTIFSHSYI